MTPTRGRHASPVRRREDARLDLERHEALEDLRRKGYALKPSLKKPSVFEAGAWTLRPPLLASPDALRLAHRRARRLLRSGVFAINTPTSGSNGAYSSVEMNEESQRLIVTTFRLSLEELAALRRVAAVEEVSISNLVRRAVRSVLEERVMVEERKQ